MMKVFSCLKVVGLVLLLTGCGNDQQESQQKSIRESVRKQDSIGAKDRLERLKRLVREESRPDSLRDSIRVLEE